VVIVGAGFGGLGCARRLNRSEADVLLLDRGGYHLFTPLLYQVATALLNPGEIAYPLRALFRRSPNVRVSATVVTGIDLRRRVVRVSPGEEIPATISCWPPAAPATTGAARSSRRTRPA
jgi:NADH dehydrogenase